MTSAHPRLHDMPAGDHHTSPEAALPPWGEDSASTEFPMQVIVDVTDGLAGLLRVAMMLRARGYRVRNLALDHRGGVAGQVRATVLLTAPEADLLLRRLRRITVVTSAPAPDGPVVDTAT